MSSYNYKYIKQGTSKAPTEGENGIKKSFWQSLLWAEILGKTSQAQDSILCSGATREILLERRSLVGKYTGLYALGVDKNALNEDLYQYIEAEIREKNDLFLQIEPLEQVQNTEYRIQSKSPFRRFIEPVTAILNLETDEEKLFASFAEKGRYNIRLAQKRGVTTKWALSSTEYKVQNTKGRNKTYLEAFFDLLEETTERDGFSHNSLSYYKHFVKTLEENNAGGLLVAEKDGVLHAAGIFVYWNDEAIYYYGASSSNRDIRRDMATYLLQWEAIREGMKRKCSAYDFLGISEDGKGKLAGVTEFKLRFNPEKVQLPNEVVLIYRPFLLKTLQLTRKVKKLFTCR